MFNIDCDILSKYEKIDKKMKKGVALYGAGQNGRWCLKYLKKIGVNTKCFYDSFEDKIGTYIDQIPVLKWHEKSEDVILVTAKHCANKILEKIGEENAMSFDTWFIIRNLKAYGELSFYDSKSNEVKEALQKAMIYGDDTQLLSVVSENQYFCLPQFWGRMNETYVDVGAYVGDTVEKFIFEHNGCFNKIYAFEPGVVQNKALNVRCNRLKNEWALSDDKIVIKNKAVGVRTASVKACENPQLQSLSVDYDVIAGGYDIQIVSLDNFFKHEVITFLKADIEGMEMEMLRGGEMVIKRDKPKIAICVYHKPDDLLEIYRLLKQWVPEYKMSLRQHSSQLVETVLYCYL